MGSYVRITLSSAMILAILGSGIIFDDAFAGNHEEERITICHVTGSDSNPTVTIEIAESAWTAHQAHGDSLGACTGDSTRPTVAITYSTPGPYKSGDSVTITATFSEAVKDSPIPEISISLGGSTILSSTDMTKSSGTVYTYSYTVGAGDGTATVSISDAQDVAGNTVSTITSGSTFDIDNTAPTAAITYSSPAPYKQGTTVTITATFDSVVKDTPTPQISISGANTLAASEMTKSGDSGEIYTYSYTVGAGDGTATVSILSAQDIVGNNVVSTPTSGGSFKVDNTGPVATLSYTSNGPTQEGPYATGTQVWVTAIFDEAIRADGPVPQFKLDGVINLGPVDMNFINSTAYQYTFFVADGDGKVNASVSSGQDALTNPVSKTEKVTFEVDNTKPVSLFSANVKDNIIMVFFSERILNVDDRTPAVPQIVPADFEVEGYDILETKLIVNAGQVHGREILLNMTTSIPSGDTPLVSIKAGELSDLAGNKINAQSKNALSERTTVSKPPLPDDTEFTLNADSGGDMVPIGEGYKLATINLDDTLFDLPKLRFEPTTWNSGTSANVTQPITLEMTGTAGKAKIPENTQITSDGWNGVFVMPKSTSAKYGANDANKAIKIGATDRSLTFSAPIHVTLTGETGNTPVITEYDGTQGVIPQCTVENPSKSDIQTTFPQSCYRDNGTDLIVYTLTASTFSSHSDTTTSTASTTASSSSGDKAQRFTVTSSVTTSGGPEGGFGGILQGFEDGIVRQIYTGDTLTIRLDLDANFGNLSTLNLFFGNLNSVSSMEQDSDAFIQFDQSGLVINDDSKLFSDVKFTNTEFDGHKVIFYDIKFSKPLDISDIGIYGWNTNQEMFRENNPDIFSVIDKDALNPDEIDVYENEFIIVKDLLILKSNQDYDLILMPVTIDAPEFIGEDLVVVFTDATGKKYAEKNITLDENGRYNFNQNITKDWYDGKYYISLFNIKYLLDIVSFDIKENVITVPQCYFDETYGEQLCPEGAAIKEWVKQYIELYQFGLIDDEDFHNGMSFLIDEKVIDIPSKPSQVGSTDVPSQIKEESMKWYENDSSDESFLDILDSLIRNSLLGFFN